jgi:hypothetical protein
MFLRQSAPNCCNSFRRLAFVMATNYILCDYLCKGSRNTVFTSSRLPVCDGKASKSLFTTARSLDSTSDLMCQDSICFLTDEKIIVPKNYIITIAINISSFIYFSPIIVWVIKPRKIRWAVHVARMGEGRGVYRVLVGKPEGK